MANSKKPIATINGVNVYTEEQHLLHFVDMLSYPQYINVYEISDKESLQGAYDMLDEYKCRLENFMEDIQSQIDILEEENDEE